MKEVRKICPDIIQVSATAHGSSGPIQATAGQDMLAQASSGMVAAAGDYIAAAGDYGERPVPAGNAIVDQHGRPQFTMGIAAAFVRQIQKGEGTPTSANLLNAALHLQTEPLT